MSLALNKLYTSIDRGDYQTAVTHCDRLLKKTPSSQQIRSLKALSHARAGQIEEAIKTSEDLRKLQSVNIDGCEVLLDIFDGVQDVRVSTYISQVMTETFAVSGKESIGRHAFFYAVESGDLKAQRIASVALQKRFTHRDYFFYMLSSMELLSTRLDSDTEMKMLEQLTHRMAEKAALKSITEEPNSKSSEEIYLCLDILERHNNWDVIIKTLDGLGGQRSKTNLDSMHFRFNALNHLDRKRVLSFATECWQNGIDDWTVYVNYVDSTPSDHSSEFLKVLLARRQADPKARNPALGVLYFTSVHNTDQLLNECVEYFHNFCTKACCFEDIEKYVLLLSDKEKYSFCTEIVLVSERVKNLVSVSEVLILTNIQKFRCLLTLSDMTPEERELFCAQCLEAYTASIKFGKELVETDNQYGDDLLLTAVQVLLELDTTVSLVQAYIILEQASVCSKHNFQIKLYQVIVNRKLGAFSLALQVFRSMDIKHVQRDTLSYILLDDTPSESPCSSTLSCLKESQFVYASNRRETPEMLSLAYKEGAYSKVEEFVVLKERLEGSLWRYQAILDGLYLEILLGKVDWTTTVVPDFPRKLHDNRSKNVTMNCRHRQMTSDNVDGSKISHADHAILDRKRTCVQRIQSIAMNRFDHSLVEVNSDSLGIDDVQGLVRLGYAACALETGAALTEFCEYVEGKLVSIDLAGTKISTPFSRISLMAQATKCQILKLSSIALNSLLSRKKCKSSICLAKLDKLVKEETVKARKAIMGQRDTLASQNTLQALVTNVTDDDGLIGTIVQSDRHLQDILAKLLQSQSEGLGCARNILNVAQS